MDCVVPGAVGAGRPLAGSWLEKLDAVIVPLDCTTS